MTDNALSDGSPLPPLIRLSGGSYGGKGEGILRIADLISGSGLGNRFPELSVSVPRTLLVGTESFDAFMDGNRLWETSLAASDYHGLRRLFLSKPLPDSLVDSLSRFLSGEGLPLIVRSSSLLEDSLDAPFSGVYESYVIPNSHPDKSARLAQLLGAIRLVYASLFSSDAKEYRAAAGYPDSSERMAVVIQELVGSLRGKWFYPKLSGTAQSYNYYPLSYAKPEDGMCVAALGLGAWVVDGGASFRFCPKYPAMNAASPELAGEGTQYRFLALDPLRIEPDFLACENAALEELDLGEAEGTGVLDHIVSTWDRDDSRLVPGTMAKGSRILDLAPILKYQVIPFAECIDAILAALTVEEGGPVEIEYALDIDPETHKDTVYLLQVKPLHAASGGKELDFSDVDRRDCFIVSDKAMGNGNKDGISDIVWIDPLKFNRADTHVMAAEITTLNRELGDSGLHYLLAGPGRFGSRDPWLGVPVTFPQIARARVIVETDIPGFSIDFSFGSHFLHNIIGTNSGYVAIPPNGVSFIDWDWLRSLPREKEGKFVSWTRLPASMEISMDGKKGMALVKKAATGFPT